MAIVTSILDFSHSHIRAASVGGERMYEKARKGESIELAPRKISIFQFDIERSLEDRQNLIFRVTCSKGTYIRHSVQILERLLEAESVVFGFQLPEEMPNQLALTDNLNSSILVAYEGCLELQNGLKPFYIPKTVLPLWILT
uniref:tRNA pseudouridine(55) synthase n=1 Tax=Salix viminalis TaxID=40686 RepID=A0A6N2NHS9_SALVM